MSDIIGEPLRQCGVCGWYGTAVECNICKFVDAAVAAEREACAKIADAAVPGAAILGGGAPMVCREVAERIRERSDENAITVQWREGRGPRQEGA